VLTLFWSYSGIVLLLAPVIMFMMAVGAAAATEDADVTLGTLTGISIILLLV
jgi:prophage lp1 protein 6